MTDQMALPMHNDPVARAWARLAANTPRLLPTAYRVAHEIAARLRGAE